jgi:hypothetical protein
LKLELARPLLDPDVYGDAAGFVRAATHAEMERELQAIWTAEIGDVLAENLRLFHLRKLAETWTYSNLAK